MNISEYYKFLETKKNTIIESGFDIPERELCDSLFPFQKYCVRRALKAGKFAMFEDCGMGKTLQQLEWARQVGIKTNRPVLILAPLGVIGQTIKEGERFGYTVKEINESPISNGCHITNYENMGNINPSDFAGIVLDESSILKNFTGKIRNELIRSFSSTPYKLCCTATPSPNDVTELCNHAEFLDVMTRNEMLAMYFVHDGGSTSDWRLKGHAKQEFWDFVSTWAVMLGKPSDIGYSDEGYNLPNLNIIEDFIQTDKQDNNMLFNDVAVSATDYHKELRRTMRERMMKVSDIVNSSNEN